MTLILPNKREWFGYRMSWSAKRPIRMDYLLLIWKWKNKMIFLKTDKNTTLQRKVSTPQSFKRKIQLILKNFSWISSFRNHYTDLISCLYHHHGWPCVFQPLLNYVWTRSSQKRYIGSLSKTRSQSSAWPSDRSNFWTTSWLDPPKRGT